MQEVKGKKEEEYQRILHNDRLIICVGLDWNKDSGVNTELDRKTSNYKTAYKTKALTLNLLAPTTVGARINPQATNVIYV